MDGRDETQREREPHPMLEVHDSRRGHIPGSEGARSKTRGIISHAGGARSSKSPISHHCTRHSRRYQAVLTNIQICSTERGWK